MERRLRADADWADRMCLSLKLGKASRIAPGATLMIQGDPEVGWQW